MKIEKMEETMQRRNYLVWIRVVGKIGRAEESCIWIANISFQFNIILTNTKQNINQSISHKQGLTPIQSQLKTNNRSLKY